MPARWILVIIAMLGSIVFALYAELAALASPELLQAFFRDHGALGTCLYVLLFSLLQPFGVLGMFFIAAGTFVFDAWTLFFATWLGAIGAGIVGFSFARSFGRGFAERHLPASARRFDARLARNAFAGVLVVRLVAGLWQPAHFLLGLSQVGFAPFVLGTALGFAPQVAILTFTSKGTVDWFSAHPSADGVWLAAVVIAGGCGFALLRRRQSRASAAAGLAPVPALAVADSATDRSEPSRFR